MFMTREAARRYERAALVGRAEEAEDRQDEIRTGFNIAVHAFELLHDAGVDVPDALAGLIDETSNAYHAQSLIIDEAGWTWIELDLEEARELLAKVKGAA